MYLIVGLNDACSRHRQPQVDSTNYHPTYLDWRSTAIGPGLSRLRQNAECSQQEPQTNEQGRRLKATDLLQRQLPESRLDDETVLVEKLREPRFEFARHLTGQNARAAALTFGRVSKENAALHSPSFTVDSSASAGLFRSFTRWCLVFVLCAPLLERAPGQVATAQTEREGESDRRGP